MRARLFLSPLDGPVSERNIDVPTRLLDAFPDADVVEWFKDGGCVRLNGHIIPPDRWNAITIKPHHASVLDFVYVPAGKKTFALLATVALVAATVWLTGGGAATLFGLGADSIFAAGGIGANLLAAGVGLAGSLAISALTAPPKAGNQGENSEQAQAGASGNTLTLLDTLPVVIGKIGYSPPYLAPPYTVWDGDDVTAYVAVGVQGRCLIENIKINGLPIADIPGAAYEIREGVAGAAARTMFTETVIEERDGLTLSEFKTELLSTKNDILSDQADPDASSPSWHTFRSSGNWSELVFRFMFPSGIVYTSTATAACVALEMETRKVGDVSWRRLPVFYISDQKAGAGPMRCEVRLKREKLPAGRFFSYAGSEYPIFGVDNEMAAGETFTRLADDYFGVGDAAPTNILPTMTAATTSGVTFSASTEKAGANAAWKAADSSGTTFWSPNDNTLPGAWLKIDLGSAQTVHAYQFVYDTTAEPDAPTTAATAWQLAGSNDDSAWTDIDAAVDIGDSGHPYDTFQISAQASYRYYRWTFTANNGAASAELCINTIALYTTDNPGTSLVSFGLYGAGRQILRSSSILCQYATLDENGAILYLDPAQWDAGEYEIRARRGWAFRYSLFDLSTQEYDGATSKGYFLDYQLVSGKYKIYAGQKNYRSDMMGECFQTKDNTESPFNDDGIAMIAVSAPNIQITSVSADFTRYASEWDGTIWVAEKVPTQNPAALYRDILLGEANAKPAPGESIDEDALASWFDTCTANAYEANAILQGARVGEAKQLIAAAGYASPRDADTYGIVEDKDTSLDPIRFLISPVNSKDEGTTQELPDLPDAIRAEFNDASQSYAVEHSIVYRDGMDANTARIFETVSYPGFTDATKVAARAAFDLKQAHLRQVRYSRRMGLEGLNLRRGTLVGLADDVIDGDKAAGWVKSIEVSGGNVVSITLDNIMPFSAATNIELADDISAITDVVNTSLPMGVAIRIPGGEALLKQVSEITDSNVCTFTTPFTYAGSGLDVDLDAVGLLVVAGQWSQVVRRCKVISVVPQGYEERLVVLADEAPGLFS